MSMFNVDKEDSVVAYNDEAHKYWIKGSDKSCISVTTLIEKFTQPFDAEFWSRAKALEAIMGDSFNDVKQEVYRNKKIDNSTLKKYGVDVDLFEQQKQLILQSWKQANEEACERGTAIHKAHELAAIGGTELAVREFGEGGTFVADTSNKIQFGKIASYPEVLLHYISEDGNLRLAGQADLVLVNNDQVIILDFKTNKEIRKTSHFNKTTKHHTMMKYPLSNLMDCNYWHYAMQLSTYAWMIQQAEPRFNISKMSLIHYTHDGKRKTYEVPYLKKEVEAMLKEYKRTLTTKSLYDKIRPIVY